MRMLIHRPGSALLLAVLAAAVGGCGRHQSLLAPRLDSGTLALALRATRDLSSTAAKPRYSLSWVLKSGSADHFVYAVNPSDAAHPDASWLSTQATAFSLEVPAKRTGAEIAAHRPASVTNFAVSAVDARGQTSRSERIAIIDDNIAPMVQITQPVPSALSPALVPSTIRIDWRGTDPDGLVGTMPVAYKYLLLTASSEVPYSVAIANPDSVRRYYEPRDYAGWTRVAGDTTSAQLSNLVSQSDYLFVVVAQDDQGAYTQVFSLNTNMLNMRVVVPGTGGPRLTMFNSYLNYTYPSGSYSTDPMYQVPITVPAGQPVATNWFGVPAPGASIAAYRWTLDIADVFDQTPRSDEATDLAHWSQPNPTTTSATVGPFGPGETHLLYIEARDTNGLASLGIVAMTTVAASLDHQLLIVDDTRLLLDVLQPGTSCVKTPVGRWPTAAELDTFLFAHGGAPWKCYPTGTLSGPGLFAGYAFDTLSTRLLASGSVPLSTLLQYSHVIWITDWFGAYKTGSPTNPVDASSTLRYMCKVGHQNTLAAYVSGGGNLWVAGGGVTAATMVDYNKPSNDPPGGPGAGMTFSSNPPASELVPGRMPYDIAGWRSEIKLALTTISYTRNLGRFEGAGSRYDRLPPAMLVKTPASDPLPPLRSYPGDFYVTSALPAEYLSQPNVVTENSGPGGAPVSTLDSLYQASGAQLVQPGVNPVNVCMTIYRPSQFQPVIWTGFSLWDFRQQDCKALVDWVLQDEWGIHYAGAPRTRKPPPTFSPITWQPELQRTR